MLLWSCLDGTVLCFYSKGHSIDTSFEYYFYAGTVPYFVYKNKRLSPRQADCEPIIFW